MKRHRVRLSEDAEHDLVDIYSYVAIHDSVEHADYVLEELEAVCSSLTEVASRGRVPPELDRIGVGSYLGVRFKPYRVIYEADGQTVLVHCVLDGRKDMQSLLERRLLR